MPDFKFWDRHVAAETCRVPDYPAVARRAVKEMHRQVGDLVMNEAGVARRGLLIRHLVLPNGLAGTEAIMAYIANDISKNTYVNIMAQYRPCGRSNEIKALAFRFHEMRIGVLWKPPKRVVFDGSTRPGECLCLTEYFAGNGSTALLVSNDQWTMGWT